MDGNFVITDANRAFCRMVGCSRQEVIGRTPVKFADKDYRQFLMYNRDALFSGESSELESTLLTRSGEKMPVLIHSQIINEMNRQLVHDVTDSGRFMTLSVVRFDPKNRSLRWVRAGHPPALVYDPKKDRFKELLEGGLPLGVGRDSNYQEHMADGLENGQIVAVGTDGIWESIDRNGTAYGMERFCAAIRKHARLGAQEILNAVYADIKEFTLGARQEDDITLVVAKLKEGWSPTTDWQI